MSYEFVKQKHAALSTERKHNHALGIHKIFTMAKAWGITTTGCWGFTMTSYQKRLGCTQRWDRTHFNRLLYSLQHGNCNKLQRQATATNKTVLKHSNQSERSPNPSTGNWCRDSYLLFYWLCWNKTQMRQSINVSMNCGTMCFSQSLYWPGLAEPPMSTRTGQCRSSWRRSSPTLMATCWSWPHNWSQGCQENRQQRNTSADRFILCRYQSGFQKIWSTILWKMETETLTETEILIWNIQVEVAYIIMILKSTCV